MASTSVGGLDGLQPRDACIVSAVRTPLGSFLGSLAGISAPQLGSIAIRGALEQCGVKGDQVQEVLMGNVCSAGLGQAPCSQAALGAGLPVSVPCTTINKVCSSGMKCVMLAAQSIATGYNDIVVAGGFESMSNVPYYVPRGGSGMRLGHAQLVDGLLHDGLWDPHVDSHMGECAEICADKYNITREEQDQHTLTTFERARSAADAGHTRREIVEVEVPGKGDKPLRVLDCDESISKLNADKLMQLRPYFRRHGGTITAGNSSPITDGAAALVVMSWEKAQELGVPVLAVIRGYGDAQQAPEWFTTAPTASVQVALKRSGITPGDIDYWEINQAFAVVDIINQRLLELDPERVNVHGGALALGHPLGASGAVMLVRLINILRTRAGKLGCAAICNGGGGASALVLEAVTTSRL